MTWVEQCIDELKRRNNALFQPLWILERPYHQKEQVTACHHYSDPLLGAISTLRDDLSPDALPRQRPYDVLVTRGVNYGGDLYNPPAPYLKIVKVLRLIEGCIVWSPSSGAVFLSEPMAVLWEKVGGVTGIFGEPYLAGKYNITGRDDLNWYATFEGGALGIGHGTVEVSPYTAHRFFSFTPIHEQDILGRLDGIGKLDGRSASFERGMTFWIGGQRNCNLFGPLYEKWVALGGMVNAVPNPSDLVQKYGSFRYVRLGRVGAIVESDPVAWYLPERMFQTWVCGLGTDRFIGAPLGDPAGILQRFETGLFDTRTGTPVDKNVHSSMQDDPVHKLMDMIHPFDVPPPGFGRFPVGVDPYLYWTS